MERVIHADIFIAGAGAAGIAAAVAAAESGMSVCVTERNSYPGGRATASAVGTICGLYLRSKAAPSYAMCGFPMQFAERLTGISGRKPVKFGEGLWFLPSHPREFEKAARSFLEAKNISVLYNASVERVESASGKVTAVQVSRASGQLMVVPRAVIDCSGEGALCKLLGHEVISDKEYQAAAMVFSMKNIHANDEFALGFSLLKKITREVEAGNVPEDYSLLSIVPHSLADSNIMLKMGLPWHVASEDAGVLNKKAVNLVHDVAGFIRSHVMGFENASIDWVAEEAGVRTGIRVRGKQTLADADVLSCRKPGDGICNGAWPVEYWAVGNKRVEMTYFAENDYYGIPAGCLASGEKENLFFAGKIISAEEKAIASARVIGTCFGTGYAAGMLAACKAAGVNEMEAIRHIRQKMVEEQ
jgi:hypothetical protein